MKFFKPSSFSPVRPRDRLFFAAIGISITAHALLLAVHFAPPAALRFKPDDSKIEVILVNSASRSKPKQAQALAQFDMNGGGEHDQGRATSYLPASSHSADGELPHAAAQLAKLEQQQQKLLSQLKQTASTITPPPRPQVDQSNPISAPPIDIASTVRNIARMEAEVGKQINDYNARPRRGYIGPSTEGVAYAMYYNQWKEKIEKFGTLNYPEEARGKIYGDLILVVVLNADGTIYDDEIIVKRSSGHTVLDRAAIRIVRLAAPFGRFPPDMRKNYDIFEIVTKFSFTKGDGFEAMFDRR